MGSISLQNVTKVFERRPAVCGLTLDVDDGEFLVVVGPSGCGKTTILRLIAGLESLTSGAICLAGKNVMDVPPRDRDVAMVFQEGVLYPHMNVYDNLAFPLRMRGVPKEEMRRRVVAVLEMLGLAELARRKPASLSGGQRQRVALGRAMIREPAVFLFDEPLSSLDLGLRAALRDEIKALHRRLRTTTLYVTHEQSEAMALGERVCVLRAGQMQQVGRPMDVYDRPANRFVAEFFGTPPMNFLAGRIRRENGTCWLDWAGGKVSLPAHPADRKEEAVQIGLRPHDLSLEPLTQQKDHMLFGRVSLLEPFGARTDVHVTLASGETCIVSAPPHIPLKAGDEVPIRVPAEKLHLFRPDGTAFR